MPTAGCAQRRHEVLYLTDGADSVVQMLNMAILVFWGVHRRCALDTPTMASGPSPHSIRPGTEMRYKHAMILINGKSPAQILRERIEFEGTLPSGALKLQTFLNHGVDCALLATCGQHLAYRFTHATQEFTKILAPRSGVMLAQACAVHMRLPMVIAVTKPPMTSSPNAVIYKHTRPTGGVHSEEMDLYVSSEVRQPRLARPSQAQRRSHA